MALALGGARGAPPPTSSFMWVTRAPYMSTYTPGDRDGWKGRIALFYGKTNILVAIDISIICLSDHLN